MNNRNRVFFALLIAVLFMASAFVFVDQGQAAAAPTHSGYGMSAGTEPLVSVQNSSLNQLASTAGTYTLLDEQNHFDPSAIVIVTISLKTVSGFANLVNSVSNPASTQYRQYVSTGELGNQYGISTSAYNGIVSYFEGFGITVYTSSARISLTLQGTVQEYEEAFHTQIGAYAIQYTSNGIWNPLFGNESGTPGSVSVSPIIYVDTSGLDLPASIAQYVSGITGLDGMLAQPDVMLPFGMNPSMVTVGLSSTTAGNAQFPIYNGNNASYPLGNANNPYTIDQIQNISYANFTWTLNSLTPTDAAFSDPSGNYQFIYPSTMHVLTGASNLWSGLSTIGGAPDLGQGITVAVIEVGTLPLSWLQGFSQEVFNNPNQITDRLSVVPLLGANLLDGEIYGWTLETALDIEYIAAMAPDAHIDLVAVPNPDFSAFDYAYQYIAQNLVSGNNATDSITITSNSYGSDEAYTAFFGSPTYMQVENTLLSELNLVGVTNFFATGDYGSYAGLYEYGATSAGIPAIANGSTSVGGGQLTAESAGQAFPNTGVWAYDPEFAMMMQVAPASGAQSFTYWAYGEGLGGTFKGIIGGGFGQSLMTQQPWWQNALDTYTSGARMDPVVSGAAAFNMSVYTGFWNLFYGGTSFATPITAGEWALIEEQANIILGTPALGDINPVLYGAHNAYEAGISSFHYNPYLLMQNIGSGFNYGPTNSFAWYYFNLSIAVPSDPIVPWWMFSLESPAGNGWNYLQGLGMIRADVIDQELLGLVDSAGHALLNEEFTVLMVTPSGLEPITTLTGGQTYTFQILLANGQAGGLYKVYAYSGGPDNGAYGGGTVSTLTTSSNGMFTYTPAYNMNSPTIAGSEYGYFKILSQGSRQWSFQQFAVNSQPSTGTLTLGVTNALGMLETGIAEVPMFIDTQTGFYNYLGATGEVFLNGNPVSNAVVHQISVNNTQFSQEFSGLPVSSYAPGVELGTFLTDGRGMFNFWTDAGLAELNASLYTQVDILYATYNGLTSNAVTVFVEPQTGSFYANVAMGPGGTLTGQVTFSDMKYVNYVNVSIGSAPGQYINETFAPSFMDSTTGVGVSGVFNGVIPVTFTTKGISGPVELHMVAGGYNDLSFKESFFGFTFITYSIQNPIVWSDPINVGPATQGNNQGTSLSPYSGTAVIAAIAGSLGAVGTAVAYVSIVRRRR